MRRFIATLTASAAMLGGLGLASLTTAAPAHAAGWCDGTKSVVHTSYGHSISLPVSRASGSTDCIMSEGASGPAVTALQTALLLCNNQNLRTDGEFGPITREALAAAQARSGATPDGVYGPETRRSILWPSYLNGTFTGCAVSS